MKFSDHKKQLMKDPEFKKAYDELEIEFAIASASIRARKKHNLSQKQLAEKLGTKQSVISRVETAQTTPSVSFLKRFAKAFGGKVEIKFVGI